MLPDGWRLMDPANVGQPWRAVRVCPETNARVTVEASTSERLVQAITRLDERAPAGQGWVPRPGALSTGFVP